MRYLVDTNILGQLTKQQLRSNFFRTHCEAIADVVYELRNSHNYDAFKKREHPIEWEHLIKLQYVMAQVDVNESKLIDLYRYEGTADPILLAVALAIDEDPASGLWEPESTIVTEDQALRKYANRLSLKHIGHSQFIALL